jgi:transcriptional regulator with XRE-family HTH domain
VSLRYDDIGNRLKAFRIGSGLSAEEVAGRIGISRTALYRFEKGEVVKIETLEKLAELLGVSLPTLLGVGVEYIASALTYFERMRQIEETAEHIIVLAGPQSYLLATDDFNAVLAQLLKESIPESADDMHRAEAEVDAIMAVLKQRKNTYRQRQPTIVNLIAASEISRFLINGMVGRIDLPEKLRRERRELARAEVEHFACIIEDEPIGVQIGIVPETLPHTGFQIFRQPDRQLLSLSPFRLGEEPNVRTGVAMITSAPEALSLHRRAAEGMWRRALKGATAADHLRSLIARHCR